MELEFPESLKYQDSHEYVRMEEEDNVVAIGLSAYAIDELGDIVFIDLPEVDATLEKGEVFGTVESVKAVGELYAPVSGTVLERNEMLIDSPEQLPDDPYGDGWLVKVKLDNLDDLDDTLSAEEYKEQIGAA